jgi:hypothetical protein
MPAPPVACMTGIAVPAPDRGTGHGCRLPSKPAYVDGDLIALDAARLELARAGTATDDLHLRYTASRDACARRECSVSRLFCGERVVDRIAHDLNRLGPEHAFAIDHEHRDALHVELRASGLVSLDGARERVPVERGAERRDIEPGFRGRRDVSRAGAGSIAVPHK